MSHSIGWLAARSLLAAAAVGVCLAQAPGPAASVVTLDGQVSVLKDGQPWAIRVGDQVRPRQIIVTGPDGHALFRVADGSTFEVFPNSQVTFRDNPGDWRDLLEVLLGRIKVYIQKLGGQPNNNKVRTPTAIISVRGTKFEVVVSDTGDATIVEVEEGEVEVEHALLPRDKPRLVRAGERLEIFKNVPLARTRVERRTIVETAARAILDIILSQPRSGATPLPGGGGTGGGAPLPGDHGDQGPQSPPAPPTSDAGTGAPPPPPPPKP